MRQMTTKEVQQVSLEILKDVHEFCVENNIHYSLSGGTLLGAIRHNGFIPWDDDIDIQLPRADFEQLVRTYKSPKGFRIYYHELKGCESMTYCYARICDTQKTYVDTGVFPWNGEKVGIWIDVLPCDGMPSDKQEAKKHLSHISYMVKKTYWYRIRKSSWTKIRKGTDTIAKMKFFIKKLLAYTVIENPIKRMTNERKKYDFSTSEYFFGTPHYGMREWQPKKNMESFILHKFEDAEFYIMSGYEENLKSLFGDYMKLPPENQRVTHDYNRYFWK